LKEIKNFDKAFENLLGAAALAALSSSGGSNIPGLPVYRDEIGGVGTPTSDHERTKITIDTTHLLVLINGYDGNEASVRQNAEFIQQLLQKFCESDGGTYHIYK